MSFNIQIESLDEHTIVLRPIGPVTVDADLTQLVQPGAKRVIFDLSQVSRIDSLGVREWIRAMDRLPKEQVVIWERVSPAMCAQVGMISNFVGPGRIASFVLPWWCEDCREDHTTDVEIDTVPPGAIHPCSCPTCGQTMVLDELDEGYIAALKEHGV